MKAGRVRCAALVAAVAVGCNPFGNGGDESRGTTTSASPGSNLLYTCGRGGVFPGARLEGDGDLEHAGSRLGRALQDLLGTRKGAIGGLGWRVVWEEGDEVLAAAPTAEGRSTPYVSALFERSGNRWSPVGWGDCRPTVVGDRSPATWQLESEPDEGATELAAAVSERYCSSARELTADNTRVDVAYSDTAITILVSADPLERRGAYHCRGSSSEIVIDLDEPVGDRVLLDGAVYPPARRGEASG